VATLAGEAAAIAVGATLSDGLDAPAPTVLSRSDPRVDDQTIVGKYRRRGSPGQAQGATSWVSPAGQASITCRPSLDSTEDGGLRRS